MLDPKPKPIWKEEDRLTALYSYEILDTPEEEDFDDIAKMAALACGAPISLVNFVAAEHQWFKAKVGVEMKSTSLDVAICKYAILEPELLVVPDTLADERFAKNPLVTGNPHLRFYAGALIKTPEGVPLGTMCVLDYKPRELSDQEAFVLKALARQVMTQLDLRRALREKQRSEDRLTLALESSGFVGIWDWDLVEDRIYADPRFVAIFAGERDWILHGAPLADYTRAIHPDDAEKVKTHIDLAIKTGALFQLEYRLIQKDGSIRWIDARGRCRYDEKGTPIRFPGVAVDITDRKRSEQAARDASDRFQFMAESMPQKIFTAKANGDIDYFNPQWMEFTGLSFDEIKNWGWKQFMHPDDLDETIRIWSEQVGKVEFYEMEHRFRRHDGVYHWHLSRGHPMKNAAGEVIMWIGSCTDIDDQRRANEILETTVAERTAKLQASVGELEAFSYSISHDMRAPLRAMLGFADILKEDYGPKLDADANRYLDRISTASARMDDLIQDVLSFSQLSRLGVILEPVNAARLIREIVESYPNLQSPEVDIIVMDPIPDLLANEAAFTQCVSNLLGNAVKFVAPGTKPQVYVSGESSNGRVRLWFKDNGIGIAERDHAQIFDIFHRVNRTNEGTGIGLAIVKKAVEKMGGNVGLESTLGEGTSFWLELPAAPLKVAA